MVQALLFAGGLAREDLGDRPLAPPPHACAVPSVGESSDPATPCDESG